MRSLRDIAGESIKCAHCGEEFWNDPSTALARMRHLITSHGSMWPWRSPPTLGLVKV